MQSAGLLGVMPALSGLTVATNTAKHRAVMANITRHKTSFISFPIHFYLALICNSQSIQENVGNVTHSFDASAASTAAGRIGR
ncbi:hypothetical protein V1280_000585 [Bradyrhizobium sp. AZCC 2230]